MRAGAALPPFIFAKSGLQRSDGSFTFNSPQ